MILVLPYIINWFFVACRISSLEGACEVRPFSSGFTSIVCLKTTIDVCWKVVVIIYYLGIGLLYCSRLYLCKMSIKKNNKPLQYELSSFCKSK